MQELTEDADDTLGISSPDAAMYAGMLPRAALEVHRNALVAAAAGSGLESVWLEYAGSGDSGGTSEIGFDPETPEVAGLVVNTLSFTVTWDRVDGPRYAGTPARRSVEEVLEEMTDLAITVCGHTNYEDNEGGYGTLALDFGTGALTLDHYDYVGTTENLFYELGSGNAGHAPVGEGAPAACSTGDGERLAANPAHRDGGG
jgi:hypothetical protein